MDIQRSGKTRLFIWRLREFNKYLLSHKLKDINGDAFVDGGCKEFYVQDTNKKYKSIDSCLYEITDTKGV